MQLSDIMLSVTVSNKSLRQPSEMSFIRSGSSHSTMDVSTIDHVNLCIPSNDIDAAVGFYGDQLGFDIEGIEPYRRDEQSFFDVRLAPVHVIHLWPTAEFGPPSGDNFNHVALLVEADSEILKEDLVACDISITSEHKSPLGATGRAPAVYVEDPFGYQIELKATAD